MTITNITIGADPEFFLQDANGNPISAIEKIGGSKHSPKPISEEGHFVQEDNVMVEFCIPPCKSAAEFSGNILYTQELINDNILRALKLKPLIAPSAEFSEFEIMHPMAQLFGCDPDFCAYNGKEREVLVDPMNRIRFAGGHIHVGYDNPNKETNIKIVKYLDLFLGVPSVILDKDDNRRSFYGQAGSFRHKKYGVEFRSLSNFWIKTPELCMWVFNSVINAIDAINNNTKIDAEAEQNIREIINKSLTEEAYTFCEEYALEIDFLKQKV